tara:strand:+ start:762 stop:1115 length:354 start_codon:yes stop_codon:yes gene_type:complete
MPNLALPQHVRHIIDTIVRKKTPEKIVLFGSHARQEEQWDSDLDILVVMETDLRPLERVLEIRRLFRQISCALDILVYTPDEVDYWHECPSSFIYQILAEGHILYDRTTEKAGQTVG